MANQKTPVEQQADRDRANANPQPRNLPQSQPDYGDRTNPQPLQQPTQPMQPTQPSPKPDYGIGNPQPKPLPPDYVPPRAPVSDTPVNPDYGTPNRPEDMNHPRQELPVIKPAPVRQDPQTKDPGNVRIGEGAPVFAPKNKVFLGEGAPTFPPKSGKSKDRPVQPRPLADPPKTFMTPPKPDPEPASEIFSDPAETEDPFREQVGEAEEDWADTEKEAEDVVDPKIAAIAKTCRAAYDTWCTENDLNDTNEMFDSDGELNQSDIDVVAYNQQNPDQGEDSKHKAWLAAKQADGWTHGHELNEDTKQHPELMAYHELPPRKQLKARLYKAITAALLAG